MFSSATQSPPCLPPPRHNFVVSAITFEVFKLRSSNLTHALLIQISRTSSIIDIVVLSKMVAGGHFVKKNQQKKNLRINLKWPEMRSKVNFGHPKWPIDLKWPEIFRHPKWTSKMADRSEIAINAIKSDFRTSKMSAIGHFVKDFKKNPY